MSGRFRLRWMAFVCCMVGGLLAISLDRVLGQDCDANCFDVKIPDLGQTKAPVGQAPKKLPVAHGLGKTGSPAEPLPNKLIALTGCQSNCQKLFEVYDCDENCDEITRDKLIQRRLLSDCDGNCPGPRKTKEQARRRHKSTYCDPPNGCPPPTEKVLRALALNELGKVSNKGVMRTKAGLATTTFSFVPYDNFEKQLNASGTSCLPRCRGGVLPSTDAVILAQDKGPKHKGVAIRVLMNSGLQSKGL